MRLLSRPEIEVAAWREYLGRASEATVYHSPEWTEVCRRVFGFRPRHLAVEDNGRWLGFLPLFTKAGRRLTSSPLRDRGGALADNDQALDLLLAGAQEEAAKVGAGSLEIKQYHPGREEAFAARGFSRLDHWVASATRLPEDLDALWRSLNNKARGKVRQARKQGLVLCEVGPDQGAAALFPLFWANRRALGVPTYGLDLFRAIGDLMVPAGLARYLVVRRGETDLAAMLVFTWGDTAIDAYSAYDAGAVALRPNDFMIWEVMAWAHAKGFRLFDFGADSPSQAGLLAFKAKWGAEQFTVPHFILPLRGAAPKLMDPDQGGVLWSLSKGIWPLLPSGLYHPLSALAVRLITRQI